MLKMRGYKFILKVTKFQLPTVYRFSKAEGTTWLWTDSAFPPPWLSSTGAGGAPLRQFAPLGDFSSLEIWSENNRKISITKEICITIDFDPPEKIPRRKPALVLYWSQNADFLSSQKPLAASWQVFFSSQNNFQSLEGCDNLLKISLTCL